MKYCILTLLVCLTCSQLFAGPAAGPRFRAGAATSNITPPLGGGIVGGFVPFPATNVHDELHARCLVLDDGKTRLALVVCDLLGIHRAVSDEARKLIRQNSGLPPEQVLICAVHTHSACSALGQDRFHTQPSLDDYQRFVVRRIADGVQRAIHDLRPAQLASCTAQAPEHVFNRRWFLKPGTMPPNPFGRLDKVKMNPPSGSPILVQPAGPTDPTISILALREPGGRPIAVFSAYSLHYVGGVGSGDISADYYGMFCHDVERWLAPQDQDPPPVAMMANGTSGDINNINFLHPRGRQLPYVQMHAVAGDVAHKVCDALAQAKYRDDVTLAARYREPAIGCRRPTPDQLQWARETLAAAAGKAARGNLSVIYAQRTLQMAEQPQCLPIPLQVFRIGDVCLGTMPVEIFCEIGLEFRQRCPLQPAFLVSLAHGYFGYLPTPRQHELGGYETWLGTNRLEPRASEKMLDALLEMAAEIAPAPLKVAAPNPNYPVADGPFKPTMDSLTAYRCPEWFRDAKFGIWAHWGPQAVPMDGDWYARGIYEEGNKHYKYHLEHYGHPSQFGYKDIIPLWKAEKWDPDRLMGLYQKAGAKYFVSMGSHHDNFFLWNSKLHRWNSVNMGPHRDVVGTWQKAAQKYGLRFGVSEHLGASFTWFQSSHRADKKGPQAGVPYDGADPRYQDLYHFPAAPDDKGWYSKDPRWQQQWYREIRELVDNYHPDLLYSDGGVPFGNDVGLSMIAHFYNSNAACHGGRVEAVYNCKQKSEGRWVEDLERGIMPRIDPNPWQTDTSIGDWFYDRNRKFRPVSWVIDMLVDNVSKNGNLLLNVVQRPDGSLDPEVEQMLKDLAGWQAVNGEALFGSRPWLVYGEGAVKAQGGHFKEDFKYTAQDIRFTTRGPTLYAIALGWPADGRLLVKSLARPAGAIHSVSLLGFAGQLAWEQTAAGLVVTLPAQKPSEYTVALKISGADLKPVPAP